MALRRTIFGKILQGITRLNERKRLAAETIRRSDLPLAAGIWLVGGSFSVRAGTKLVPPLNGVKRWFDFRPAPIMRELVSFAGLVIPPWFARRPARAGGDADILLISRSQEAVAFDVKKAIVVRAMGPESAASRIATVDKLRLTHTCPNLEYDAKRLLLVESFVRGVAFRTAAHERQLNCVATILAQTARAPRQELPEASRQYWANAFDDLFSRTGMAAKSAIPIHVSEFVRSAVACTIHGDLNGENIILNDDTHVVIDFDRVATGPAFFDILHLFMVEASWGRGQLLDALMQGRFDSSLSDLGIVLDGTATRDRREAVCCAAIAWKFSCGILTQSRALDLMSHVVGSATVNARRPIPVDLQLDPSPKDGPSR